MNVHEYSNELICIFEYHIKGQPLRSYLAPILSVCVEHRLRSIRNVLCLLLTINTYHMLPWTITVRFLHTPNEIFLRNNFILILLGYRVGLGSSQPIT